MGDPCKAPASPSVSLENWHFSVQPKGPPRPGFLCRTPRKKISRKINLGVFRFLNTSSCLFLERKSLCHMSAMKHKHARLSRSTLEDASHCLCVPCLALAVPDSPMNAVAALVLLLCSSAGSSIWGEVCALSVFTSQPSTTAFAPPPDASGPAFPDTASTSQAEILLRWPLNSLGNQVGS